MRGLGTASPVPRVGRGCALVRRGHDGFVAGPVAGPDAQRHHLSATHALAVPACRQLPGPQGVAVFGPRRQSRELGDDVPGAGPPGLRVRAELGVHRGLGLDESGAAAAAGSGFGPGGDGGAVDAQPDGQARVDGEGDECEGFAEFMSFGEAGGVGGGGGWEALLNDECTYLLPLEVETRWLHPLPGLPG